MPKKPKGYQVKTFLVSNKNVSVYRLLHVEDKIALKETHIKNFNASQQIFQNKFSYNIYPELTVSFLECNAVLSSKIRV